MSASGPRSGIPSPSSRSPLGSLGSGGPPPMLLDYDLLVSDAHVLHRVRQVQVHVCHGVASQLIVGDVFAFYVELEVLSFQPAPVGKVHHEVELHPPLFPVFPGLRMFRMAVAHRLPPSSRSRTHHRPTYLSFYQASFTQVPRRDVLGLPLSFQFNNLRA